MAGRHIARAGDGTFGPGSDDHALEAASASLRDHHAGAAVLTQVLHPSAATAAAAWLVAATTVDEYRLYSVDLPVDGRRWRSADDRDRLWRVERPVESLSTPTAIAYARVRHALSGGAFGAAMERLAGRSLAAPSVGAWAIGSSGCVRPHRLDPSVVALRLELFLSEQWGEADGGELVLVDGHERVSRFPAVFNTGVVILPRGDTTVHVAPVCAPDPRRRRAVVVVFAPDDGQRTDAAFRR
jgi:hypothetical protein